MNRLQTRVTRMAMLAVCSAVLTAPMSLLAQDTTEPPAAPPQAGQHEHGGPGGGHMNMDPKERDAHQLEMMTAHLGLTEAQQAQVKQIFADNTAKMMALHQDTSIPQEDKHAKMMELMKARQAAVRAILTPEQQKKADAMQEQMKEHHEHGGPGGPGGPGGENAPPPPPPAAPQQ